MKYEVIKDFNGSPDGVEVIRYTKGDDVELVPSLAKVALEEKWVRISKAAEKEAKAKAKAEADAEAQRKADVSAIEARIASIEAELDAAPEDQKQALQDDLAALREDLDAL